MLQSPKSGKPRAIITGGSAGIGRLIALSLADQGHDLILVAPDIEGLASVAAEVAATGLAHAETCVADLTDADDLRRVTSLISRPDQPVDMLFNNAGFGIGGDLAHTSWDRLASMIALNVTALTALTRAALKAMQGGIVVNTASGTAYVQPDNLAAYAASKAYVIALTQALQPEAARRNIRLMCLVPGLVATQGFHRQTGIPIDHYPEQAVMSAENLVAAMFAGLESGERICAPGLADSSLLDDLDAARARLAANVSRRDPAFRYGLSAPEAQGHIKSMQG